jgi:hypothetical protein
MRREWCRRCLAMTTASPRGLLLGALLFGRGSACYFALRSGRALFHPSDPGGQRWMQTPAGKRVNGQFLKDWLRYLHVFLRLAVFFLSAGFVVSASAYCSASTTSRARAS